MKYGIVVILLVFVSACSSVNFKRNRLLKKQKQGYQVFLDSIAINLDTLYLNSIDISLKFKKQNNLYFESKSSLDLISLDSISNKYELLNEDYLLVVDGIPIDDALKCSIKFEASVFNGNSIVSISTIAQLSYCFRSRPILLISTKMIND